MGFNQLWQLLLEPDLEVSLFLRFLFVCLFWIWWLLHLCFVRAFVLNLATQLWIRSGLCPLWGKGKLASAEP
uniref:Uncharacterized protein n=1 Tax=Mus musculus TaxID=10090 RepID=Q3V0Q8_MOUSE|nr:unnamed protein product [Mus musculus]